MEITCEVAEKVLTTIDAGLVKGVGLPVPGQMCVEAAVCYALGLPHGDDPPCVSQVLRKLKISLNDKAWSSNQARAEGLRRLGLAQLGSFGVLDEKEFLARVVEMTIGKIVPRAMRAAIKRNPKYTDKLESAAVLCEMKPVKASVLVARDAAADAYAYAADAYAYAAAYAADAYAYAARDKELAFFAEEVVQILIAMGAPGCQWLYLAPITEGNSS